MSYIASIVVLLVVVLRGIAQNSNATCDDSVSITSTCPPPWLYCSDRHATCIDGYCRCVNTSRKDFCTCLSISGDCHIERNSASAVGTPTFEGRSQTNYSCVADENCNYDVHVVSNYEGDYNHGFGPVTSAGSTNVQLRVSGESSKPLVLVFVSYEPVNWILSVPRGVTIEKVLLGSYYLSNSDVTYSSGSVRSVERQTLPSGYGDDRGGGDTNKLLEYVVSRFGPVASFSGSYRADSWTLNIHRGNTPGCLNVTSMTTVTTTDPVTTRESNTVTTTASTNELVTTSGSDACDDSVSITSTCPPPWLYCSDRYATCIDGYCRCVNTSRKDFCTCLSISGDCRIERNSASAVGTPTFEGRSQTNYSCVANENCNYDVHVVSNYEGDYSHRFGLFTEAGNTNVQLRVSGESSKPLVLVFVSYEAVNWILSIPRGVTIDKVLLGSYYVRDSKVTYSPGSVLSVERHNYQTLPSGYGDDRGGGDTDKLLEYVVSRFGPVASFSGSYKADSWVLNIHQGNTPGCPNVTSGVVTTTASTTEPVTSSGNDACTLADSVDYKCLGPRSYCSGSHYTGSTCIDGYCRCPNNSQRDYCTCLAISGGCHIEKDSVSDANMAAMIPRYKGRAQTTYSCVANENCNYDVHVVSNYEGDYNHPGFGPVTRTGSTNVQLRVSGESSKPLVLVFVSYEPVNWILSIPQGVTIEKVLLGSYYLSNSDVTYSSGSVRSVERHNSQILPCGYGSDTGGCETDKILEYVVSRFGPVASFSGSYRADSWTLNIHRGNTPGCLNVTSMTTVTTTDPVTTRESNTVTTTASTNELVTTSGSDACTLADSVDYKCLGPRSYCSGSYYTGSTCIDGYCRCPNNSRRDYCTCLAISGDCRIERNSASAVGTPTFEGRSQTNYSCVADENCNYDVHVVSNYEGDYNHGFGPVTSAGSTNVQLRVSGGSSKPLVLVFVSYEPVNWILSVPRGVTIEKVLLGSYYLSNSDVTYSSGSVRSVERHNSQILPCGYGSDTGGCETDKILEYVVSRFGPVASFSGSYRADSWTLNIHRGNTPGCLNVTSMMTVTTTDPVTTRESNTVTTTASTNELVTTSGSDACAASVGTGCYGSYCSGNYYTGSACIDGYCRCPNNSKRDFCTCLAISGDCRIERNSASAVGTPTFEGQSQTNYSCVANENCNYNVHIVSNYEGDGHTGFRVHNTGTTYVDINVSGLSLKPLILVFVSYEPVDWILNITSGVVVDKVLLGSYYLEKSNVTYSPRSVLSVERHNYQTLPYGYGSDTGGGKTDKLLEYVVGRFGPVASYSGSYRADSWTLNIHQRNTPDCPYVTSEAVLSTVSTTEQISACAASVGTGCYGSYCSGSYYTGSTCIDGYCRCPNNSKRDFCTCLAISGDCRIERNSASAVGTPTFEEQSQTTYSCVADENCNYDVHVVSNYEGDGHTGFRVHDTGTTYVDMNVIGPSLKPLILVFVSYEPVNWILNITSGVVVDKVLLGSYYLEQSNVTYSPGSVQSVERHNYQTLPCGYGSDTGGCKTDKILEYVVSRFGPVASFSGSYSADSWTLNMHQRNTLDNCPDVTSDSEAVLTTVSTTEQISATKCQIERNSASAVGTPTFKGQSQTTYSCVANENCNYDVHVISNYEGEYNYGFDLETSVGSSNVQLRVSGKSHKPLVLVLASYEPVNWILSIPQGVTIEKVLLGSYNLTLSNVAYCPGSVRSVERHNYQTLPYGYGSDTGGGKTDKLLEYVVSRFGPVASFSGSYKADSWILNIHQGYTEGCPTVTSETVSTTISTTTEISNERDSVYFEISGRAYYNNSIVTMLDIGERSSALLCKTNMDDCCKSAHLGEFYYPNGVQVPIKALRHGFYRNRGEGVIRLNRREGTEYPTGIYRCEIPDASGELQNIYITLSSVIY